MTGHPPVSIGGLRPFTRDPGLSFFYLDIMTRNYNILSSFPAVFIININICMRGWCGFYYYYGRLCWSLNDNVLGGT